MYLIKNKINYTVGVPRHQEKGGAARHLSENAQSAGLGGILKYIFLQGRNLTKIFYRGKTKSGLYYKGQRRINSIINYKGELL